MKKEKKEVNLRQSLQNAIFSVSELFRFNKRFVIANFIIVIGLHLMYAFESTYYVKWLIEAISSKGHFEKIVFVVCLFVGVRFLADCIDWIYYCYESDIVFSRFAQYFNRKIFKKAGNVELACYEDAEFYNKYTMALDSTSNRMINVCGHTANMSGTLIRVIVLLAVMISIDPGVSAFLAFPLVGNFVFGRWLNNIEQKRYKSIAKDNRVIDYVLRVLHLQQFAKEIRLTDIFSLMQKKHFKAVDNVCFQYDKYAFKAGSVYWVKTMLPFTFTFEGILAYCSYRALVSGTIDLAEMTIMTSVMTSAAWGIIYLFNAMMEIHRESVYIQNARDFLAYEEKIPENAEGIVAPDEIESIEFKNVCFTYKGESSPTLNNISFKLEKGTTVALVGHNGAGKTTLVKLLLRLYDAESGEILLNGINIKKYEVASYRKLFSAAFQDYQVIAMSVLDNIVMGVDVPDCEAKAEEALRKVGLWNKVSRLENGIHTTMTREFDDRGAVLSGGQSQKLAVARALMQDGKCMVFDEPSSALDPIAEYDLFKTIVEETEDKTTVIISHRLSSVKEADIIYMLEKGEIVERGTHKELMDMGGIYYNMYIHQANSYMAKCGEEAGEN